MDAVRRVLAHVHLFKNAGTSVERGLQAALRDRWASFDKPQPNARISARELIEFVDARPDLVAVSSHQLRPPFAGTDHVVFDPLVFLRHPVDRIRSAYEFERRQRADTPSAQAAASMPFAEWIDFHRQRSSLQCENFQVFSLTQLRSKRGTPLRRAFPLDSHVESARELLGGLPVVGLVEHYGRSCELISERYGSHYPGLRLEPAHANRTAADGGSLSDRLESVRAELGPSAHAALESDNAADLELWEWATAALG